MQKNHIPLSVQPERSRKKRFSFSPEERIRKRTDYQRIQRIGKKIISEHLIFFVAKNDLYFSRIGLIVSKKVGNAVNRNRVKRILREIFRQHKEFFSQGIDVLVFVRPSAKALRYAEMVGLIEEFHRTRCSGNRT